MQNELKEDYKKFTDKLLKEIADLRAINLKLVDENLRLQRANNHRMIDAFCLRNKNPLRLNKAFGLSIN